MEEPVRLCLGSLRSQGIAQGIRLAEDLACHERAARAASRMDAIATNSNKWGERPIRARGAKPLGENAEWGKLVDPSGVEPLTSTMPL